MGVKYPHSFKPIMKTNKQLSDIFDPNRKNQSVIVLITDFCNNQCAHCCFSCGPKNDQFMSMEVMVKLSEVFKDTNDVAYWFNLMGGEPTLHPKYEELVNVLAGRHVRFVTNGWWIKNEKAKERFLKFTKETKAIIHVGVSRDRYHPKGIGKEAFDFLMSHNVDDDFGLSTPNPNDEEGALVSVGRAFHNYIAAMRSTFGSYCLTSKTRMTSFTVLEDGTVTFCPFGIWPIGMLEDGIDELYKEKVEMFERFNRICPSCRQCYQAWDFNGGRRDAQKQFNIYNKTSL